MKEAARLVLQEDADPTEPFRKYWDDPVEFARKELGIEPWPRQADFLRAAAQHKRVACRSGHKVGKSLAVVILALWWVATRPGSRAVITAPTFPQVKNILWRELRRWYPRIQARIRGGRIPLDPSTGIELDGGRQILGISTDAPENLAGLSGPFMMFIVDEGSGFPDDLYEAIHGNRAGGDDSSDTSDAKLVAISNPTQIQGWFYEAFLTGTYNLAPSNDNADRRWRLLHISSLESPNVTGEGKKVPGLATRAWLEETLLEAGPEGEESNLYRVRVLGEFPIELALAVVPEFARNQAVLVCVRKRPPYFIPVVVGDFGYVDLTAILFGYYDFQADLDIYEDELIFERKNSGQIVPAIRQKEKELWPGTEPRRFADVPEQMRADLASDHGMTFAPVYKAAGEVTGLRPLHAMVNRLRVRLGEHKALIHPRCEVLIAHLKFGVWNTARTQFRRPANKNDPDDLSGHFDALAAAVYFNGALPRSESPWPTLKTGTALDGWTVPPTQAKPKNKAIIAGVLGK